VKNYVMNIRDNKIYLGLLIAGSLLAVLMLAPLLSSGFVSDDSFMSYTKGTFLYYNQNLGDSIYSSIKGWLLNIGRFDPLSIALMNTLFTIIGQNAFIYKLTILIFIIINILSFGYFIKLMTASRSMSLLAILMAPLFFQIRIYHDPIVSFHLLMQVVFLFTILSMISLISYLRNGGNKYLISSLLLYLLSLLSYELTYPFFILYFIIIYINSGNKGLNYSLRLSAPFLFLSLLCISIPFIARIYFGIPLVGAEAYNATSGDSFKLTYVPNLNPMVYIITLAKQTTAAFPLSYSMVHKIDLKVLFSGISPFIAGLYFLFYLIISNAVVNELFMLRKSYFNIKLFSIFGLFLLILPGALVALSPKYQHELSWGTGYLPVYISYFGLMIITLCAIYKIYNKLYINKRYISFLTLVFALIFSLTGSITYASNVSALNELNDAQLYPRIIIEDGLEDGLFKFVPDDAVLLTDPSHEWDQPGFYLMNSGVRLGYVGNPLWEGYLSDKLPKAAFNGYFNNRLGYNFSNTDNIFYLRYFSVSKREGYAVLGKVRELLASTKTLDRVTISNIYIYIHHDPCQKQSLSVKYFHANVQRQQGRLINLGETNASLVSSGEDWELYSIDGDDLLIDAESLHIDEITQS